jgi:hypothetical protein
MFILKGAHYPSFSTLLRYSRQQVHVSLNATAPACMLQRKQLDRKLHVHAELTFKPGTFRERLTAKSWVTLGGVHGNITLNGS